uniref:Putative disease resistance protein n=1 Tax=Noccaea caerulescens TaxID=107243 RepID=A0A1J3G9E1_NOCCA
MADTGNTDEQLGQDSRYHKVKVKVVEALRNYGPQRVLLAGKAGIGKTRLAKDVGEFASVYKKGNIATNNSFCFLTLCLHLNKKYKEDDEWSLYENIASQLSVYSDFEETEIDDRDEDEEEEKKSKDLNDLKKNIIKEIAKREAVAEENMQGFPEKADKGKKLVEKTAESEEKAKQLAAERAKDRYLLLILDDEGSMTKEDLVMKVLKLEDFLANEVLKDPKRLKVLITRRKEDKEVRKADVATDKKGDGSHFWEGDDREIAEVPAAGAESSPTNGNELDMSKDLVDIIDNSTLVNIFSSVVSEEWKNDKKWITDMVKQSKDSPAAVFVLANSLKQITKSTSNQGKKEIDKLIEKVLSSDRSLSPNASSSPVRDINPVLCLAYELLGIGFPLKDAILDCFWHSLDFFEHCGCVYYRDLITQWILEGYFDPVRSVEKAYQDGHSILMELINRGMLKIQENNVVVPERAMRTLIDPRRRGLFGRSKLRFSRVYRGDKKKGIGKITQIDDMIKTVQAKKGDSISTILVSGDRLRRVTPGKYFEELGDLEVLGLFEPTLEPFVPALLQRPKNVAQRELEKLRVLVIRDCDLLDSIEELKALRGLNVLEVSGASSLKKITDDFFKALSKLQSLHLSGLMIESSPPSISELTELHCLIIKNCPLLKDLPDIQELKKLEVVDVSGAHGLKTCFDNTPGEKKNKSKNKNFYHLTRLQLLDFSESQIERLPIFQDSAVGDKLHSVTRLLLRDCTKLRRLPSLKPLSGLQILDLSGTTSLVEMLEVCFEDKKELTTLNLTGTNLSELATTIDELTNLNKLLLKDSKNLEVIPKISKLTNLEVIDVSGCTKLHTIEGSFEGMHYLREIDLTDTKVMTPPKLPTDTKITCPKRITLADRSVFEGEKWSEITDKIKSTRSDKDSSSEASQEISENKSEETGEIQPSETRASESTEKGDFTKERLLQVPIKRDIYKSILSHFDSISQKEFMKIHETEDLSNAEFVSFVDINSTSLKSSFSEAKSVKVFSLKMCRDIKEIFSAEDEKSLGSLETLSLSITNLPLLEKISCGVSFQNLKELHVECCPNIKTLFLEAAQMPSSLEVLHIKYCEKLEKVFKEGEVSTLTTLCLYELPLLSAVGAKLPNLETFDKKMCPKLLVLKEDLTGWVEVDPSDASPQN